MDHRAIREAVEAYQHMVNNGHTSGFAFDVAFTDLDPVGCIGSLLADLDAKTAEVERLQALRPVAMTPSEVAEAFDSELRSSYTDFEAGIRTAEIYHGITQKEQGK